MSIQKLASEASTMFRDGSRDAEHHNHPVRVLADEAPEWLRALCYGRDGVTTSDFRVEAVEAAIDHLAENDIDSFDPEMTETHSRAGLRALAVDSQMQEEATAVLSEMSGSRSTIISVAEMAASRMMRDIAYQTANVLEVNLDDDMEP